MATGIPANNGKKKLANSSNGMSFRLEYEGKSTLEDILATTPALLQHVVKLPGQPTNKLIYGDNLRVLRTLLDDNRNLLKVSLIYLDPPYATEISNLVGQQSHRSGCQLDSQGLISPARLACHRVSKPACIF